MAKLRPLCVAQARVFRERACLVLAVANVCFGHAYKMKEGDRTANASIYHLYKYFEKGSVKSKYRGIEDC